MPQLISLTDPTGATALVAPELGGWLLRYARPTSRHGLVEVLYYDEAVLDRYPKDMWAGNPLLFPMVSFNHQPGHEHHYEWNGRLHALPQHGFARRSKWAVVAQSVHALTLELADSDATRAAYPFAFRHRVTYSLQNGRLHMEQVVENAGDAPMPFSTGIHPYFNLRLTAASVRDACFIELPDCERLTAAKEFTAFESAPQPAGKLPVSGDYSGTLFLGTFKRRELTLVDPRAELDVVLNWEDAPQHRFAALWSRTPDAPFFCLEPWTALPNSFRRGDVLTLSPRQTFRAALWMDLIEP
jgi:galactose mutarotase-like enzyme